MKHRLWYSGIVSILLVVILAGCGGGSTSDPTATVVVTATAVASAANIEPTGELSTEVVIVTHAPEPPAPTSTLYALGEPTPTVIAGAKCSYWNPNTLSFLNFEEMRAEIHVCNDEFSWPPGYEIDVERYVFSGDGTVGGWEVGSARMNIAWFNSCAWMSYWMDLAEAGDQEAADKTLQYMVNTIPYWSSPDPPGPDNADPMFTDMLDRAELGDPGPIMKWLTDGDCRLYQEMRLDP